MLTEKEILALGPEDYMNEAQLRFFKSRLEAKVSVISERLQRYQDSMQAERHSDAADTASSEESRNMAMNMAAMDRKELQNARTALAAIEEGEYGYCQETGEPIGLKRLLLVPESLYSVETMRTIESKQQHLRSVA